jgi:glyoxylate utilization-related uncharacterized protein
MTHKSVICRILVALSLVTLSLSPLGAQDIFQYPLSDASRPRFDAVCAELASHPVVKGSFDQIKTISRLKRSLKSQGNFIIASDLGMFWDTKTPFPSVMAVGADYILQTTPSGSRSKIDAKGNETFLRLAETISAIFTGNARRLLDNFEVYFIPTGLSWKMGLIPKEKAIQLFASRIIMEGDSVIRTIDLTEQNGDTIQYMLSNHRFFDSLDANEKALFSEK